MPRRCLTSGRKFSITTSALATMRLRTSTPRGCLRSRVIERLLRWRLRKSKPIAVESPSSSWRASTLMTEAPMSASWRTAVGPERARVRSTTVMCSSGSSISVYLRKNRGARLRGGIAPCPRPRVHRGEEVEHGAVERLRLLQVDRVARLRDDDERRRRDLALHEDRGLEARVVLVARHDQRRHLELLEGRAEVEDRGARLLHARSEEHTSE